VNINNNNLLHYVLIILLMIAPLRSLAAVNCDMDAMHVASSHAAMSGTVMQGHDMSAMHSVDTMHDARHKCCCCGDASAVCSGACALGINASLIQQTTLYSPVYTTCYKLDAFSSEILFRELTPPSRPPATLHS
jgi:hypothetical protein